MKSVSNIIYYPAGCYGTFFEWLCSGYDIIINPLTSSGSSHSFSGHQLSPVECVDYFTSGRNYDFVRCHPSIFESFGSNEHIKKSSYYDIVVADLEFLSSATDGNILVLYPTVHSMLWHFHNVLDKLHADPLHLKGNKFFEEYSPQWNFITAPTEYNKLQETINSEVDSSIIHQWGGRTVYDLKPWDLRELLVFHWFSRNKDLYTCFGTIKKEFSHIKFLSLDQIRESTSEAFLEVLAFFNNNQLSRERIDHISRQWINSQRHLDKDKTCTSIVENIISQNINYSWYDLKLTFIDDVYIQKHLSDAGLEVCGTGVDALPRSTKDFLTLIRKNENRINTATT